MDNKTEKRGRWVTEFVPTGYFKKCSVCGARWMLDSVRHVCIETPYCHNCGVRLEKENEQ